jgi:hypothetical protein
MMIQYDYTPGFAPHLWRISEKVKASDMTDKNIQRSDWNSESGELSVTFVSSLSAGDKTLLDDIVADSGIQQIYKNRKMVLSEIFEAVKDDPAQLGRILNSLDTKPSFAFALDGNNYVLARMIMQAALAESLVTQADYDLIDSIIPITVT